MTDSVETPEIKPSDITDFEKAGPWKKFVMGAALGGFVSTLFLVFSMEFSQLPLAEIGVAKPALVIAIALLCGLLTVKFKGSFFNSFADLLSDLGL